ncbi:hypothetical protein [Halobacillus litoralis]|uniref:hypothetical protein n=1 Tax=Halobacillus litoralis TaxID=45668 RepID=UPI001CD1AABF|nr:hypothetical protein [Halobacillus litoralis]MCA1021476.1 hypothetical protein [Halobacillus litoralis]
MTTYEKMLLTELIKSFGEFRGYKLYKTYKHSVDYVADFGVNEVAESIIEANGGE